MVDIFSLGFINRHHPGMGVSFAKLVSSAQTPAHLFVGVRGGRDDKEGELEVISVASQKVPEPASRCV